MTGPVTVSYAVNGRTLGTLRCDHAGDFKIEKPVPDGLIEPGKFMQVTFEANPRWVSPEDGAQLSFLLRSAGFLTKCAKWRTSCSVRRLRSRCR